MAMETPFEFQYRICSETSKRFDQDLDPQAVLFPEVLVRESLPNVSSDLGVHFNAVANLSRWASALPKHSSRSFWDDNNHSSLPLAIKRVIRHCVYPKLTIDKDIDHAMSVLYQNVDELNESVAYKKYLQLSAELSGLQTELSQTLSNTTVSSSRESAILRDKVAKAHASLDGLGDKDKIEAAIASLAQMQSESAVAAFSSLSANLKSHILATQTGLEYLSLETSPRKLDIREDHNWHLLRFDRGLTKPGHQHKDHSVNSIFESSRIEIEVCILRLERPWFDTRDLVRDDYKIDDPEFKLVSDESKFRRKSIIPGVIDSLILARRAFGVNTNATPTSPSQEHRITLVAGRSPARYQSFSRNLDKAKRFGAKQGKAISIRVLSRSDFNGMPVVAVLTWSRRSVRNNRVTWHRGAYEIHSDRNGNLKIPTLTQATGEGGDEPIGSLQIYADGHKPHRLNEDSLRTLYGSGHRSQLRSEHRVLIDANLPFSITVLTELLISGERVPLSGVRIQFELPEGGAETSPGIVGTAETDGFGRAKGFLPVSQFYHNFLWVRIEGEGFESEFVKLENLEGSSRLERLFTLKVRRGMGNFWPDRDTARIIGVALERLPTLPKPSDVHDWSE